MSGIYLCSHCHIAASSRPVFIYAKWFNPPDKVKENLETVICYWNLWEIEIPSAGNNIRTGKAKSVFYTTLTTTLNTLTLGCKVLKLERDLKLFYMKKQTDWSRLHHQHEYQKIAYSSGQTCSIYICYQQRR